MRARVVGDIVFLRDRGRPITVLPDGTVVGAQKNQEVYRRVAEKARRLEKEIVDRLDWRPAQWRPVSAI